MAVRTKNVVNVSEIIQFNFFSRNYPYNDGETPIFVAASNGHTEIVKFLVGYGANRNAPKYNGFTPMHMAAWNGHTEIVRILIGCTETPNDPVNYYGCTPYQMARQKNHFEIMNLLKRFRKRTQENCKMCSLKIPNNVCKSGSKFRFHWSN